MSSAANSGVKIAVSTGARFSMIDFFASTSQAATITAATPPAGSTHVMMPSIAPGMIGARMAVVRPSSSPPPSTMSRK